MSLLSQCHGVTRGGGRVMSVIKCDKEIKEFKEFREFKEIEEIEDGPP